ncbi:ArsR/SmtB family transcription factor [Staphylococcus simulans]|uniref:ArsR/SmtB family transcription factor n=1 Tax=Staphylococcus simulans TaxID=1286 RepID=UPI00399ABAE1
MDYQILSHYLKAISNPIRLEILNILSCGELCANDLLTHFQVTQPTLSHHMKALVDNHLVTKRQDGNKHYYRLNTQTYTLLLDQLHDIGTSQADCVCHTIHKGVEPQ